MLSAEFQAQADRVPDADSQDGQVGPKRFHALLCGQDSAVHAVAMRSYAVDQELCVVQNLSTTKKLGGLESRP